VASNNLAWILCETGGSLDEALGLAQTAKEQLPDSTNVSDTLGWIYYKRGAYRTAIDLLTECVNRDTSNPSFNYHLGMAYIKIGDKTRSKESLLRSLKSTSFRDADSAKKALEQLK
jgi:predicted Zn-dependent protease